jgi:hypothetical protein
MSEACCTIPFRLLVVTLVVAGCANDTEFLANRQRQALEAAGGRAAFETNCPEASGTELSKAMVQAIQPEVRMLDTRAADEAQHTIGAAAGCRKRKVFVFLCPYGGDGCFMEESCKASGKRRIAARRAPSR